VPESSGAHRPRGPLPTSPPPDAVLPLRSPNAPLPGEEIPSHYRWCFACGSDHPTGLHMRITAGEGLAVRGVFTASEHHQGAPGLAHGGVLTTAVDEILGSLNWLLAGPAVTGRLECDFRRPVPVGSDLHIDAEVIGTKGRKVFTKAVGRADHVRQAIEDRAKGGPAWRPEGEQHTVEVNP